MNKTDKEFLQKRRPKKQHDVHIKDYELVISHYKNLITKGENVTDAYVNMGFIYLDKEDYEEALKCFLKILELEPETPEALNNVGYVYEKMDMFDSAKKFYEKALDLNADNIEAVINIGHILELQGDYHGAVNQYKKAIEMDRQNDSPRFCLAVLYDHHDMYDEAIDQYSEIIRHNPGHIKSLYNMGRINFQLGNYSASMNLFKMFWNGIRIMPTLGIIWDLVHEINNDYPDAIAAYRKSLALNPFHEDTNFNLANLQYIIYKVSPDTIKVNDIIRRLHFVLSLNPHNQKVGKLLSRIQQDSKDQKL